MVMSTQTLTSASQLMGNVLIDYINIYDVGEPQTVGVHVTRPLTLSQERVRGLVQTTVLENAIESLVSNTYSVKVASGVELRPGQAVQVVTCPQEPSLIGKTLLIDKISENGASVIRKAVATDFHSVNQQGKEGLTS